MVATFVKFELKNLLRDEMMRVMLFYPIVLGGLVRLFINRNILTGEVASATAVVLVVLAAGFDFGMIAGFSMLDDRDDQVFAAIRISPMSLNLYIWFKLAFAFVMAVLAGLATMIISGSFHITPLQMVIVALLSAMQVPINAFLIGSLASNRAEGLGATKITGLLVICPVVAWFLLDWKEWIFAFVPGFWPAKAMQSLLLEVAPNSASASMNVGFYGYIGLGFVWCMIGTVVMYSIFRKRV